MWSKSFWARHISCGLFRQNGSWRHPAFTLDDTELILCLSGELWLEAGGAPFRLRAGDVLLLPPGVPHKGARESEGRTEFYWAHFLCGEPPAAPQLFQGLETENLLVLFRQLVNAAYAQGYPPVCADCYATLLALELEHAAAAHTSSLGLIETLRETIRSRSGAVSVAELARLTGYNADYLSRLFKKHTGSSLSEAVLAEKMRQGKRLLSMTTLTVAEIGALLGYRDPKTFGKNFRRTEKLSPTAWRRAYAGRHINAK